MKRKGNGSRAGRGVSLVWIAALGIAAGARAETLEPEIPAMPQLVSEKVEADVAREGSSADAGAPGEAAVPRALPVADGADSAAPPDVERRLRELEETVRRQDEIIRRLEETVEALRKPATLPAPPVVAPPTASPENVAKPPTPPTSAPASANNALRLRLRGFLQTDARFFPAEGGRTGVDSFLLRRVRPAISGSVGQYADFTIVPIFDEGRAGLIDAFVDVRQAPQLQFRFGLFKTPFSLERLQSGADLQFVERSLAQNLAPNRDTGFMVHGDTLKGRMSYAASVLTGAPDAANVYGDAGRGKDFAGRIFARPFAREKGTFFQGLGLGLAATYGSRDEAFQSTFRTAAREPFFRYRSGTAYAGDVVRLAPQFYHYYRQFGMMGEAYLTRETLRRAGVVAPVANHGWFLQGSYVLTGEDATFRSVVPEQPFDPSRGQWGAFELALRYSRFQADREVFTRGFADPTQAARTANAWTFGLNWYLNSALKFQLNYERTDFNGPLAFGSAFRDREDVILTRFQLVY